MNDYLMFTAKLMDYLRGVEKFDNRNPTDITITTMVLKLNLTDIPNREKQVDVFVPFNFRMLYNILSYGSVSKLIDYQHLPRIVDDVRAGDREAIKLWAMALAASEKITRDECNRISNLMDKTIPDPSWKKKISIAEVHFGRSVTIDDVRRCCQFDKKD